MINISKNINSLVKYGMEKGLLNEEDKIFTSNRLLEIMGEDSLDSEISENMELEEILKELCDEAIEKGIIEDSITHRDLFDTKLMAALLPRPSEVIKKFWEEYEKSPEAATDFYYNFSQNSDYIRTYRIKKDLRWSVESEYGDIDISINRSKPEKDPKAIAAAKTAKQSGYPKCLLCVENEGYAGRINHPARNNHRIIPLTINNTPWMLQYSPYVYYNEHCIVFNSQHTPMSINDATFKKLLDFVTLFPHYFVGSNADLPIVGGSILTHDHFQGGRYEFAMAKAPIETKVTFKDFEDVEAGIVKWPMSTIRICHEDTEKLCALASRILAAWRGYSDESAFIFAETDGEPHNTITPIARKRNGKFELDLVLRNNITTDEHPMGLYHPHDELHHIKKENIGLIEVMGLAILPARLVSEMEAVSDAILNKTDLSANELTAKHAEWANKVVENHPELNASNVKDILNLEVGKVFCKVLEHAGVYKCDENGRAAFIKFINSVK